ncbi:MAG: hypothetical protein COA52_03405 [Hyphomicrobiales bacterium]|nr:MAG: hypothetical protein COA52_03405 [Hyphomicrobiales bacterium]
MLPLAEALRLVAARGDLSHLVLFLWAISSSFLLLFVLRELVQSNRRFNEFIREIARINSLFDDDLS